MHAQETTAGLEGVARDAAGAVIANATITLTSPALIGEKKVTTNSSGYYRFTNLPPGVYTLTAASSGFANTRITEIKLEVGRVPSINVGLVAGATEVVEVSTQAPQIDVTESKTQTNVTREEIDYQPRGRSYESVIALAPGARYEPLQGGYQVDGGATAENAYLVNGQETASLNTGKQVTSVPFEFIQEVQVKTSGISAENGGALGGVIDAVLKRGGNTWHGEAWTYYEGDPMDASPATTLRSDPQGTYSQSGRTDYAAQNYTPLKDHFRFIQPGAQAGGYILKDRLWFTGGFAPLYRNYRRTVNITNSTCLAAGTCPGVRAFNTGYQTYFTYGQLDLAITNKLRLYGGWEYSYERASGTALPTADSHEGLFNSSVNTPIDAFYQGIGYVAPNSLYIAGADFTASSSTVLTTRFGRSFQNYGDRGLPVGDRYYWATNASTVTGFDGIKIATAAPNTAKTTGTYNIANNLAYFRNVATRTSFSQDIAHFRRGFLGAHNLKGGYQLNHLYTDINQQFTNDLVYLYYGSSYGNQTALGGTNCAAIQAANQAKYGASATGCRGTYGYLLLRDGNEINGRASSNNQAFYAQDDWTVKKGVTLNLGVRFEKEYLPSFNQFQSGISFGLTDKFAPRLGGAWDVMQNGKMKLFGSYAVYYDLMKLNLAIGSFGGNYYHNCAYAVDTLDYASVRPQKDATGHFCPAGGSAVQGNFASGSTPAGLRFIENNDLRIPANDPSSGTAVDPALKPYREHESVFGADYQINRKLAFESRWSRRRLDRVIEDVGYVGDNGEAFIIANPGFGIDRGGPTTAAPGLKYQPKGERNYDGVEFRLTKQTSNHWFASFSYTYSHLRGNYSGLTSTDIADAGGARANPNNNRAFDEPYLQFDAYGRTSNGLLATDRPNSFKLYGYYQFKTFLRNDMNIGLFQQSSSGTPLSSFLDVNGSAGSYPVYVEGRGKFINVTRDGSGNLIFGNVYTRRTPWYNQTDLSFVNNFHVSASHEAWRLGFEANFTNLLNSKTATVYSSRINATASTSNYLRFAGTTAGSPNYTLLESAYDYKTLVNSTSTSTQGPLVLSNLYGQASSFQTGRTIRLKAKFVF